MAQIDRRDIIASLRKKGFRVDETKRHTYYCLYCDGKRQAVRTRFSRGSDYKSYSMPCSVKSDASSTWIQPSYWILSDAL